MKNDDNMKKRYIVWMMMTVAMISVPFFAFSQVKQIFKVVDFDTKQPVAGATTTLFGQMLTTNAQGIAVTNLPADKKDAYLPLEQWKKEGCVFVGYAPESFFGFFQTKDTLGFYMAEKQRYRKEMWSMFEQLYRHFYQQNVMPTAQDFRDSIKMQAASVSATANALVESTFSINDIVKSCNSDASNLQKYESYQYDMPQFNEVLARARKGEVNEAVSMAKEHVRLDDNSRENLDWIDFYRFLRLLESSDEDEDTLSNYSAILYKNHYEPYSNVDYITDLNRNSLFEKADSIARLEKSNNRNPRYTSVFEPSFVQYLVNPDKAKAKVAAEQQMETVSKTYEQYPFYKTLSDLYWMQKNLYYAYAFLEDSVSATHAIDTSLATVQKLLTFDVDDYAKNQHLIEIYQNMLNVVGYNLAYIPQSTLYKLYNDIYIASLENYQADTSNLFLQLQLAENAVQWLQNVPDVEGRDVKQRDVLQQLVKVEFKLSDPYPEFYAVQNVQVASQLLGSRLVSQSSNEELQQAFRQYERSYDVVNAAFPNAFNEIYLNYNATLETYLTAFQQFVLSSELSAFTDRLISIEAKNDPQKILTKKAEYANHLAETLYKNEMYDESVAYYLQSNELYENVIPKDEQLWLPYLNNYLQMGDAHLNLNQYDKAVMTYQKVLDFEPQIPASVTPKYTTMKGSVYYYVGDVHKAMGEMSRAEKEYKIAEKYLKRAVALGDANANTVMGEMYWNKAVMAAQEKNMKKCRQMVEQSVAYYEKAPMLHPLQTYERAKTIMGDLYKETNDLQNYYRTVAGLTDFYREFVDYNEEYPIKLLQNAETMLNSGAISKEEALQYSQDILNSLVYLDDQGHDVNLAYLRGEFNMARVYTANDSVLQAINMYRDCINVSEILYADTAFSTHRGNMMEIYDKLAECYEKMAEEIDTAHSELWNYRAIDARDTLISLMKEVNADGDVNMTYRTAIQYKNNAIVFYNLDMIPSAQDYLDKSIELLLMLYNSEYKAEVEDVVVQHYYLKGVIYAEKGNDAKAEECFRKAIHYGEDAEKTNMYHVLALSSLIELLEKDKAANSTEIDTLTKKFNSVKKKLK
jgi:tetratricopeptide (TPR) repeat protein